MTQPSNSQTKAPAPAGKWVIFGVILVGVMALFFWIGFYMASASSTASSNVPRLKVQLAQSELATLNAALDLYQFEAGRYPTTAEGLAALLKRPANGQGHGPYLDRVYIDPWEHPFIYACPGKKNPTGYDLSSAGPDGQAGTADDLGK